MYIYILYILYYILYVLFTQLNYYLVRIWQHNVNNKDTTTTSHLVSMFLLVIMTKYFRGLFKTMSGAIRENS